MVRISLEALRDFTERILIAAGLRTEDAATVADVYMRATLRGVGHHDIYYLTRRLKALAAGKVNPQPVIRLRRKFNAVENYDGDNGLGEICASFLMERAMRLADEFGIGFCAIRNSNHFLSAAGYVERAAEGGYLGLIFSRTEPMMNAPGTAKQVIGNMPLGFAAPAAGESPLMLDICLAYASIGKLDALIERGERVPSYWGKDAAGQPTTDPAAIRNGGSASPIGGHKGFGLALLVEILTAVLADGKLIDEPHPNPLSYSQAAVAIKPEGLLDAGRFAQRTAEMLARLVAADSGIQFPGWRSAEVKAAMLAAGAVELKEELVAELNEWAERMRVAVLT